MMHKINQISNGVKQVVLKLIKFYQSFISPGLGYNCRFYPSCSDYIASTIKKNGLSKGLPKGIWRILKCNPFNKGGIDLP